MIFTIANHELRSLLREGRFRTAALLLSGLFLLSLFGAYDYYTSLKKQHTEAAATAREQWDNQKDKNPHSAAHYGTYVFKPIYPLSYFDRGVDGFTGNTLFLEAHRSNQSKFKAAEDRGAIARLGTLTPAFVLGMLFPLFIIVLGFGSAAAERENGNLRLLLAQGVKPSTLFWGKSLGLWAAVLALALPFFAAGAVGLLVASAGGEHWLRYALTMLLYLAYFGCFIHLTLLISAWAGRQNVALVGSLGVWVLVCLVVPKAAVNIAKQQHPAPTWQAYNDAIKEDLEKGVDGHDPADAYTEKLEKETLAKYGVDSVQHLPFNWDGFIMQKGEEHETYVFQKHKSDLLEVYQRQRGVHQAAAVVSPFVLTGILSQRLAGTDVGVYFDFLAAAEKYRIQLVGELNGELTQNFKYGDWEGKRGKAFFAKNAQFEYAPPTLGNLLGDLAKPAGAMLMWLIVSGLGAVFFFNRLKPV
jgi:ABC-2 type transport system permease protein